MKISAVYLYSALVALCLSATAPCRADGIMDICVPGNYAPYSSIDKNHNYVGFDIELWKEMKIDGPFRYVQVDFSSGLAGLEDKTCDMFLTNLSVTKERAKRIDFSKPYLKSGLAVMVLASNEKIHTPVDLQGKIIAVSNGTTGDIYVTRNIKADAIMAVTDDDTSLLDLLLHGKADAIVQDLPILQYLEQTSPKGQLRILDTLLAEEEYALGFPKGSALKNIVDMRISALQADGTIERIYRSYFTRKISMK